MVASTVGKLSALLAADLSDEQARRLGLDTLSAAARERRPDAVLLPSGLRLRLAVQRAGALSQPALVNNRYSVAATAGRWPAPPASTRCASTIRARCWRSSRYGPYYLFGYSLGGTLAARDCRPLAPARRSGGLPRPAGYLAAGDAKLGRERGQRAGSGGTGGDRPRARSVPRRPARASLRRAVPALSKVTMPMRCGC